MLIDTLINIIIYEVNILTYNKHKLYIQFLRIYSLKYMCKVELICHKMRIMLNSNIDRNQIQLNLIFIKRNCS